MTLSMHLLEMRANTHSDAVQPKFQVVSHRAFGDNHNLHLEVYYGKFKHFNPELSTWDYVT